MEARFSKFLQPLKDLASNWNIDVAKDLEEYLDELEGLKVSFDGGKTNLNFAEASLLIQGTTVVYSRKVEYLYSLVYHALDVLSAKATLGGKKKVGAKTTEDPEAEALLSKVTEAEEEFLMLDDSLLKPATQKAITLSDAPNSVALRAALSAAFAAHNLPALPALPSSSSSASAPDAAAVAAAAAAAVSAAGGGDDSIRAALDITGRHPLAMMEAASVLESWGSGAGGGMAAFAAQAGKGGGGGGSGFGGGGGMGGGVSHMAFLGAASSFRLGSALVGWNGSLSMGMSVGAVLTLEDEGLLSSSSSSSSFTGASEDPVFLSRAAARASAGAPPPPTILGDATGGYEEGGGPDGDGYMGEGEDGMGGEGGYTTTASMEEEEGVGGEEGEESEAFLPLGGIAPAVTFATSSATGEMDTSSSSSSTAATAATEQQTRGKRSKAATTTTTAAGSRTGKAGGASRAAIAYSDPWAQMDASLDTGKGSKCPFRAARTYLVLKDPAVIAHRGVGASGGGGSLTTKQHQQQQGVAMKPTPWECGWSGRLKKWSQIPHDSSSSSSSAASAAISMPFSISASPALLATAAAFRATLASHAAAATTNSAAAATASTTTGAANKATGTATTSPFFYPSLAKLRPILAGVGAGGAGGRRGRGGSSAAASAAAGGNYRAELGLGEGGGAYSSSATVREEEEEDGGNGDWGDLEGPGPGGEGGYTEFLAGEALPDAPTTTAIARAPLPMAHPLSSLDDREAGDAVFLEGRREVEDHLVWERKKGGGGGGGGGINAIAERAAAAALNASRNGADVGEEAGYWSAVQEHINNFMHGADAYLRTSKLAARVEKWQERMEPLLAAEEAREEKAKKPSELEGEIISSCCKLLGVVEERQSVIGAASEAEAEGEGSSGSASTGATATATPPPPHAPMDFITVLKGASATPRDIPRMFLAVLQLANNGNVDIFSGGKNTPSFFNAPTAAAAAAAAAAATAAQKGGKGGSKAAAAASTRSFEEDDAEDGSWMFSQDVPFASQESAMEMAVAAAGAVAGKRGVALMDERKWCDTMAGGRNATSAAAAAITTPAATTTTFGVKLLSRVVRVYEHPSDEGDGKGEEEGGAEKQQGMGGGEKKGKRKDGKGAKGAKGGVATKKIVVDEEEGEGEGEEAEGGVFVAAEAAKGGDEEVKDPLSSPLPKRTRSVIFGGGNTTTTTTTSNKVGLSVRAASKANEVGGAVVPGSKVEVPIAAATGAATGAAGKRVSSRGK